MMLASGSEDHAEHIRLWQVSIGQCLQILKGHNNVVHSIDFSPDGTMLVSGSIELYGYGKSIMANVFKSLRATQTLV